jgi:indolepyruvate ferredoxin oxidoreductase
VLLNGTQALVRLMLMQARARQGGGSEHGGLCHRLSRLARWAASIWQMMKSKKELRRQNNVLFQPGLNEDLAATSIWGTSRPRCAARANMTAFMRCGMARGRGSTAPAT